MSVFRRFLALLLLLLLLIFAAANRQPVLLRFPGWQGMELPLFLPILGAFFTGIVLALLGQSLYSMGRRLGDRQPRHKTAPKVEPKVEPVAAPEPPVAQQEPADSESTQGDDH